MIKSSEDKKADISEVADRHEPVTAMEPLLIGGDFPRRGPLTDLAVELAGKSAGFRRSLPPGVMSALADLDRSMNCYYSNLVEGHDTHPIDIERALKDIQRRSQEARSAARSQGAYRRPALDRPRQLPGAHYTADGIRELHRRFEDLLPDDMLWVKSPTRMSACASARRTTPTDVRVGRHIPISPGAVPRFLAHFREGYSRVGRTDAILAAAAAHHRLSRIHPYLDGNGRVTRLMSHAMLQKTLDTGGVWSVARGLARSEAAYKSLLAECDLPRRNDLDGRGNLSEEALASFTHYFLETCVDQVTFMEGLMQPERLRARILLWAEEEARLNHLPPRAGA